MLVALLVAALVALVGIWLYQRFGNRSAPLGETPARIVIHSGDAVVGRFGDTPEERKAAKALLRSLKGPGVRFMDRGVDRTPPGLR